MTHQRMESAAMTTYSVTFEVDLPDDAPESEVQQFVEYELGARGCLSVTNEALRRTDLHSCNVRDVWVSAA